MANETMRILFPLKIVTYPQGEYEVEDNPMEITFYVDARTCVWYTVYIVVMAHSLYELTFFGYDVAAVEANTKKEIEILRECHEEIENGTAEFVYWDEVCKDIGYVDDRTEEEKESQHKQFERINSENKRVYEMLLS